MHVFLEYSGQPPLLARASVCHYVAIHMIFVPFISYLDGFVQPDLHYNHTGFQVISVIDCVKIEPSRL